MARRNPRLVLLAALAALVATGCALDEADLVSPGSGPIEADPGDLRVLSYRDDPTVEDHWIDVLEPDGSVVREGDGFREEGSRAAEPDEPADVRRLFDAVGDGRTVLVQVNCRDCDGGVPSTPIDQTGINVWEFVVGDTGSGPVTAGPNGARTQTTTEVEVGEHIVVARPGEPAASIEAPDGLVQIARHRPEDDVGLHVDVFATLAPTEGTILYLVDGSEVEFPVAVR